MARYRLSGPARTDLAHILATSAESWGEEARRRYAALLAAATKPAKAKAKQGAIHSTTCLALTMLRLGACQQPSTVCQWVMSNPKSLA